ncbi:hypothetical protein [Streptomyces luteireticuli]|uniref:hypothetical protein n=1 Tax=Streptomyces luteireticuli TaxID=173858 RepID=UPI00355885F9
MTATTVNGLEVIGSEPAESPLRPGGHTIYFKQIRKLLLEDGSEVYGCAHGDCDFTRDTTEGVRPHLKAHKARPLPRDVSTLPVNELVPLAQEAEKLRTDYAATAEELAKTVADRDQWRKRARSAEGDLKAIRKALRTAA